MTEPGSDPVRDLNLEWPTALYETLKASDVRHMSYVPDAGHTTLINLLIDDVDVTTNVLTTDCLLYTSPSPRDATLSRMPSSA